MNKVERIFMGRALNRSGITLYAKQDALDFIEECNKNRIGLLGLDGFFITDTTTQPSLDDSVDFSNDPHLQNVYDKAIEFIKGRKDNLYFEIVCE
jgi:hypothetical protein